MPTVTFQLYLHKILVNNNKSTELLFIDSGIYFVLTQKSCEKRPACQVSVTAQLAGILQFPLDFSLTYLPSAHCIITLQKFPSRLAAAAIFAQPLPRNYFDLCPSVVFKEDSSWACNGRGMPFNCPRAADHFRRLTRKLEVNEALAAERRISFTVLFN